MIYLLNYLFQNGIFASWGFSFLVLLIRIARPRVDALGRLALATFNRKSDKLDDSIPKYAFVSLEDPSFTAVETPPEGIVIFRFTESLTFPNSSYIDDNIVEYVQLNTRRLYKRAVKKGDCLLPIQCQSDRLESINTVSF
jgi:sodium-independent sulfate anion transporter 11